MPEEEPSPGASLWDFSLAVYAQPGVAEACLGLQDRHGLDVNLLLACCWAGRRGERLDAAALDRLDARVGDWRREVVAPLRALRRRLKAGFAGFDAAALRERVKALELEAERLEQQALAAGPAGGSGADPAEAVAANLGACLAQAAVAADASDRDALAVLVAACLATADDGEIPASSD